jgi:putative ABC transport system substrate-binding protein
MRLIGLAVVLAFSLTLEPLAAEAQSAGRVPRVGVLMAGSPSGAFLTQFRQGLRELGYIEGQNIAIEQRFAHGVRDRVPNLAAELISLKVDLIVVDGTATALSAKAATTKIPIVFTLAGDPVGSGLVASLARPGGNVTGLSNIISELGGKQLELLKEAAPQVARVAVLYNPVNPATALWLARVRAAARALTVELQAFEVRKANDLASVFSALAGWRADALLMMTDTIFTIGRVQLVQLAAKNRLPGIYGSREYADAGGLMAYGPSFNDNFRRAATYVVKILKGANPADLPVEQPTKFELVINLKTARALGLTIPQTLLLQADQIIE